LTFVGDTEKHYLDISFDVVAEGSFGTMYSNVVAPFICEDACPGQTFRFYGPGVREGDILIGVAAGAVDIAGGAFQAEDPSECETIFTALADGDGEIIVGSGAAEFTISSANNVMTLGPVSSGAYGNYAEATVGADGFVLADGSSFADENLGFCILPVDTPVASAKYVDVGDTFGITFVGQQVGLPVTTTAVDTTVPGFIAETVIHAALTDPVNFDSYALETGLGIFAESSNTQMWAVTTADRTHVVATDDTAACVDALGTAVALTSAFEPVFTMDDETLTDFFDEAFNLCSIIGDTPPEGVTVGSTAQFDNLAGLDPTPFTVATPKLFAFGEDSTISIQNADEEELHDAVVDATSTLHFINGVPSSNQIAS